MEIHQPLRDTLMYVDLRERRAGSAIDQAITLEERHQLHGIINRYNGTLLESVSRKLVVTLTRPEAALECARALRTCVLQLRSAPAGNGFYSRILLTAAPGGVRDPDRWTELAFKMSVQLNGTPPDCIIATQNFLDLLAGPPIPTPRPLVTASGISATLFTLTGDRRADVDEAVTRAAHTLSGAGIGLFVELSLKIGNSIRLVNPPECPLSVGRSKSCGIVLAGDDVSRVHGRIEFANEKYFYADDSRNGTYILTQDGTEVRLQKEKLLLVGEGVISPGVPVLKQTGQVIRYRCAALKLSLGDDAVTKPR
jgi:hypothetical protein